MQYIAVKQWCLFYCQDHLPRYVRSTISGHDVAFNSERFHASVTTVLAWLLQAAVLS